MGAGFKSPLRHHGNTSTELHVDVHSVAVGSGDIS